MKDDNEVHYGSADSEFARAMIVVGIFLSAFTFCVILALLWRYWR